MYFTPSEDPVTPSSSPVMWGYATTLGVHMPMVHLADSSQTKIAAQKQPKIAYFAPPGQNFLRLRRAYKALRVGGTAGPPPSPGRAVGQDPPGGRRPRDSGKIRSFAGDYGADERSVNGPLSRILNTW